MPKQLAARPASDVTAAHQVRTLAHRAHAPADWIVHAKLVVRSWDGLRTRPIAEDRGGNPQPVRERLQACNDRGVDGLGSKPGASPVRARCGSQATAHPARGPHDPGPGEAAPTGQAHL